MRIKTHLLFLFSALFLTMCGPSGNVELANPIEGLSCTGSLERGMQCYYECPEGTVGPITFERDPSLSASKGDLDRMFCESVPASTSTARPATASPSPSPTSSPTIAATATVLVPVTAQDPLLAETISMCDLGGKLINFRIVQPAPDLTGKTLEVQIAEQESTCYVNPTNPGLLTCSLPNDISFPAHVVVSLDGALANDFVYSGVGCSILTTPTPFKKLRSYP